MSFSRGGKVSGVNAMTKQEKRARVESSDFATNHPSFLKEQVMEFYDLFELYQNRNAEVDFLDILATAKTLGLDEKYSMVFRLLSEIQQENLQEAQEHNLSEQVDFQAFLGKLTEKLGNVSTEEGRESIFKVLGRGGDQIDEARLVQVADELKYNLSDQDAQEIIHNVAGYQQNQFDFPQFNKFVERKINKRKEDELIRSSNQKK